MKQHILPKQALEVSKTEFYSFFPPNELVERNDWAKYHHKKITIGKMIEILKELNWEVNISSYESKYRVSNNYSNELMICKKELCDALWEAIKFQLIENKGEIFNDQ